MTAAELPAPKPTPVGRPRYVLALVLLVIAAALVWGGIQLLLLGGSPYYALAGIAVLASAVLAWNGDRRAPWPYAAMLAATLLWAFAETGLEPWSLQARLFAPLVLGTWVFWPMLRKRRSVPLLAFLLIAGAAGSLWNANRLETATYRGGGAATQTVDGGWPHYGGDLGGQRHSALEQINPANVRALGKAWTYRTMAASGRAFEVTPIMANGGLYGCTANNVVFAIDPDTGRERWRFDPHITATGTSACRGVAYHAAPAAAACPRRILFATADARLMALDADTGRPCAGFGEQGSVDLKRGMGEITKGYYYVSSAPAIVAGKAILGGWVLDGQYVGEPSGVIRAFDAVTGKFAWAWDMDRPDRPGEPAPGETYSRGTANSWAPISGDEALGLVYLPTGNATPDYWGAHRSPATEKYSSGVVALDAATGRLRWSFQTTHHDLWDYDVGSQPTLADFPMPGGARPALILPTKRGEIFILDRRTGAPLVPVEERPVPQGAARGDFLSPTQPFPAMPAFDRTRWREADMWGLTPIDQMLCRIDFRRARYEGPLTPPGVTPSITYPGNFGGINWGSVSVDPARGLMIVNWNRLANYTYMIPRAEADAMGVAVSKDGGPRGGKPVAQQGTPFALQTRPFLSPLGTPCTRPPFGKIAAVDLRTRKLLWSRPLGTSADSGPFNLPSMIPLPMGVPNMGGSVTTGSGLTFIAATQENAIRAFETGSGKLLWKARLPFGGYATPMTYRSTKTGRQYVVIAVHNKADPTDGKGDYLVAFALPRA